MGPPTCQRVVFHEHGISNSLPSIIPTKFGRSCRANHTVTSRVWGFISILLRMSCSTISWFVLRHWSVQFQYLVVFKISNCLTILLYQLGNLEVHIFMEHLSLESVYDTLKEHNVVCPIKVKLCLSFFIRC